MLIKDPYLESQRKELDVRSQPLFQNPDLTTLSQPIVSDVPRTRAFSGGEVNELRGKVQAYAKQLRTMEEAYVRQEDAARKYMKFQEVNKGFHEALKNRNYELNTRLRDFANEIQLVNHRSEEDYMRYAHDKDMMLKKYQEQADEVLRLRANCNCLLEQKTRLQEELNNLTFMIDKERHQSELEIKEYAFRLQSMERTYRGLVSAKDEEIGQLVNRLRLYEDENRKLNDINKTLQLTKDNRNDKIDQLSQIHHLDSNIKIRDKQNEDMNAQRSLFKENQQLREQKAANDELRRELQQLKKQFEDLNVRNSRLQQEARENQRIKPGDDESLLESSKWQGLMASINTLRDGINKEIFELFFKSVKTGEKKKQNSLVIFIENWKCLDMERLQPYVKSYFEARNSLKEIAATKQAQESPHFERIQQAIPQRVGVRAGRSNINQWILSTIQFTKNQKQSGKKALNNFLLFLFRLLTIEYRINYPMQGKSYQVDADVKNQLMHEIIKGIQLVFKYQ